MSTKSKLVTPNEAVRMLKQLPPGAMAWVLGCTPRRLRDRPSVPRNRDGTYDAQAVFRHETQAVAEAAVEWAMRR